MPFHFQHHSHYSHTFLCRTHYSCILHQRHGCILVLFEAPKMFSWGVWTKGGKQLYQQGKKLHVTSKSLKHDENHQCTQLTKHGFFQQKTGKSKGILSEHLVTTFWTTDSTVLLFLSHAGCDQRTTNRPLNQNLALNTWPTEGVHNLISLSKAA